VISISDYPIRVKDNRPFSLTIAASAKDKEENDDDKGDDASSNSASNRTSTATASRTRWGVRHNDNRRLNCGGKYESIGFG
jgi:hypothetical protein